MKPPDSCTWCEIRPYTPCARCEKQGRRAHELIAGQGISIEQAAETMSITVTRTQWLLDREFDRIDLNRYRCDPIPVAVIQELIEERRVQDPEFSLAKLGQQAGYKSRIHFERMLGYSQHAATIKRGKHYRARYSTTIDIEKAAVIVRALGIAPHEIPDL
jgi:hypothetical protein